MPHLPRFSRRVLLRSLPLALPLLYGCGGGGGNNTMEDNTEELIRRATGPLVVNGETIAEVRLVQTEIVYRSRDVQSPPKTLLSVRNTGTRTIADLQFFFTAEDVYFSSPVALSALAPGQVYETDDVILYEYATNLQTLTSRLQFAGEPALGAPYSGRANGSFTATGERDRTGRVETIIGIDNRVRGYVSTNTIGPYYADGKVGRISGTVDAAGSITGGLEDQEPDPSSTISLPRSNTILRPLSGTIRSEGDGFRFEFSVPSYSSGAERFSAFLRRGTT